MLFIFLFLLSCGAYNSNDIAENEFLDFDKDLTFDEFNELLIKYAETTSYPSVDQ